MHDDYKKTFAIITTLAGAALATAACGPITNTQLDGVVTQDALPSVKKADGNNAMFLWLSADRTRFIADTIDDSGQANAPLEGPLPGSFTIVAHAPPADAERHSCTDDPNATLAEGIVVVVDNDTAVALVGRSPIADDTPIGVAADGWYAFGRNFPQRINDDTSLISDGHVAIVGQPFTHDDECKTQRFVQLADFHGAAKINATTTFGALSQRLLVGASPAR